MKSKGQARRICLTEIQSLLELDPVVILPSARSSSMARTCLSWWMPILWAPLPRERRAGGGGRCLNRGRAGDLDRYSPHQSTFQARYL